MITPGITLRGQKVPAHSNQSYQQRIQQLHFHFHVGQGGFLPVWCRSQDPPCHNQKYNQISRSYNIWNFHSLHWQIGLISFVNQWWYRFESLSFISNILKQQNICLLILKKYFFIFRKYRRIENILLLFQNWVFFLHDPLYTHLRPISAFAGKKFIYINHLKFGSCASTEQSDDEAST